MHSSMASLKSWRVGKQLVEITLGALDLFTPTNFSGLTTYDKTTPLPHSAFAC